MISFQTKHFVKLSMLSSLLMLTNCVTPANNPITSPTPTSSSQPDVTSSSSPTPMTSASPDLSPSSMPTTNPTTSVSPNTQVNTSTALTIPANLLTLSYYDYFSAELKWQQITGAKSYRIYQDGKVIADNLTSSMYYVKNLTPNTNYSFDIVAVNDAGESNKSTIKMRTFIPSSNTSSNYNYNNDYVNQIPVQTINPRDILVKNVIFVDGSNAVSGDGATWNRGFKTLQEALTEAQKNILTDTGRQIWIAKGTYKPGTLSSDSFNLVPYTSIYGGFAGTENTLASRTNNPVNETILSGDLNNSGTANSGDTNTILIGNNNLTIDSVSVKYAYNDGNGDGGGMLNYGQSPTLTNVKFENNHANNGAGIYNRSSASPILKNVTFSSNRSENTGGGIYNYNSSPTLTNVVFSENYSEYGGSGMYNDNASPKLTNIVFYKNTTPYYGGGIYNDNSSSPILNNVVFSENYSQYAGGGMYNDGGSSPFLTNVVFYKNTVDTNVNGEGGGMYSSNASPVIKNTIFWESKIAQYAGKLTIGYSDIDGGYNSIIKGNDPEIESLDGTSLNSGNFETDGYNVNLDPKFLSPLVLAGLDGKLFTTDDGLSLQPDSPVKDIGTLTDAPTKDITGANRPQGSGYSIGAYEK